MKKKPIEKITPRNYNALASDGLLVMLDKINEIVTYLDEAATQEEELIDLIAWATGPDTGASSESLLRYMLGLSPGRFGVAAPSDQWDRGRCIRLLNKVPRWWDRLDEMAKISRNWEEQIRLMRLENRLNRDESHPTPQEIKNLKEKIEEDCTMLLGGEVTQCLCGDGINEHRELKGRCYGYDCDCQAFFPQI